jgi:hypothetical protein
MLLRCDPGGATTLAQHVILLIPGQGTTDIAMRN